MAKTPKTPAAVEAVEVKAEEVVATPEVKVEIPQEEVIEVVEEIPVEYSSASDPNALEIVLGTIPLEEVVPIFNDEAALSIIEDEIVGPNSEFDPEVRKVDSGRDTSEDVRPYRTEAIHQRCGTTVSVNPSFADIFAKRPQQYKSLYCGTCGQHQPAAEFLWTDGQEVGS